MTRTLEEAQVEARSRVNCCVAIAGAVGWVPASSVILIGLDARLVREVAEAFEVESYEFEEVVGGLGAGFAGKTLSDAALSSLIGIGWLVKAVVAAGVTKAFGEAVIVYFSERRQLA